MTTTNMDARRSAAGFTLIEVLLAIGITATVMLTVGTTFHVMLNARDVVDDLSESSEAGPRILNMIERDLRGLWTYNVRNNAVFRGEQADVNGRDADRIHFLTTTDSVGTVLDLDSNAHKTTICEVGYVFKPNPRFRDVFELWRREDPMIDDDLLTQGDQGTFQLVHDRVKSFRVRYYDTLGWEAEELFEWDSAEEDRLPKRIKIEFTIERKRSSRNVVSDVEIDDFEGAEKKYVRHFVLPKRLENILQAENARVPVLPPPPPEGAGEGPEGSEGPAGPAGPGGLGKDANLAMMGRGDGKGGGGKRDGGGKGNGRPAIGSKPGGGGGGGRGGAIPGGGQVPTQLPPGFNFSQFFGSGNGNPGSIFGGGQ
ncbi:MAG: prepilin-type N-terminal cleavage/methylation domain-containing protein [Planctomycetota bacterium]|nr:prepilin-type N-terminal cleavage/methylation domain-containing protein [Planctomycetota bacterium]